MSARRRPSRSIGSSSGESHPCVWMSAGLVAFKLCDRDFDCEHCPFDLAMRGVSAERRAPVAPAALPRLEFPGDRRYHPAHTWAQSACPGKVRIGIDAFAAHVVGRIAGLILPSAHTPVKRGGIAAWLVEGNDLLPLRSPVSGTIVGRNSVALQQPAVVGSDPYGEGWLLDVAVPGDLDLTVELLTAGEIHDLANSHSERIDRRVRARLGDRPRDVGPTAADGGEPASDARRILGEERYRRLILSFLT